MENKKVRWECDVCDYWEIMHNVGKHEYRDGQYAKCFGCTRPSREKLERELNDKHSNTDIQSLR